MGSIVVGYVPKAEGKAALSRAVEEAKLRNLKLVVVNSNRGGRELSDSESSEIEEQLDQVRDELKAPVWSTRCATSCAGSSPPRT